MILAAMGSCYYRGDFCNADTSVDLMINCKFNVDHAYKLDAVNDYAGVKFLWNGGLTYTVTLKATFNGNTNCKKSV
jgi:hypothetical protein